jgi:hypothetical protein
VPTKNKNSRGEVVVE